MNCIKFCLYFLTLLVQKVASKSDIIKFVLLFKRIAEMVGYSKKIRDEAYENFQ